MICSQSPEWCHVRNGDWGSRVWDDVHAWGECDVPDQDDEDAEEHPEDRAERLLCDECPKQDRKGYPVPAHTTAFFLSCPNGYVLAYMAGHSGADLLPGVLRVSVTEACP